VALEELLASIDDVRYSPRTLHLHTPVDLTKKLSVFSRAFITEVYDKNTLTVLDLAEAKWRDDPAALRSFFQCDEDTQVEVLLFLTLFVHEYTHRIDFFISPFGLQYYTNSLREYWISQEFFPEILDDPKTVEHVRYLAGFGEDHEGNFRSERLKSLWGQLEGLIHISYAWGDVADIKPPRKYIQPGWGMDVRSKGDLFGVGVDLEPVTVLRLFPTVKLPDDESLWYLRPLTIFETKAVVNSFLFAIHCLGERWRAPVLKYYEKVYLARRAQLAPDYFFLLDLGARIYGHDSFGALLKHADTQMVRATLITLSSVCWFALQAPPFLKEEDPQVSNPILRLSLAFRFMCAFARGRVQAPAENAADLLMFLDQRRRPELSFFKSITDILPDCVRVIDNMAELNQKRTWNPEVRKHFGHVLAMMRPHFTERDLNFVSLMGMPDSGNPLAGCSTPEDWEVTYDDYTAPEAVKEWFELRGDLFFSFIRPTEEVLERLDRHYLAFLVPFQCKCGKGITSQWASRFAEVISVKCGFCVKPRTFRGTR
jgi:hypothetical protein